MNLFFPVLFRRTDRSGVRRTAPRECQISWKLVFGTIFLGLTIGVENVANAAPLPITLQVTGIVEEVVDGAQILPSVIVAGMPFTAVVVYDLNVTDFYPNNPNYGEFNHPAGLSSISIDVGESWFHSNNQVPTDIQIRNDMQIDISIPESPGPPGDAIYMGWSGMTGPVPFDRLYTDFVLADHTAGALSSDQLPTAINPDSYDGRRIALLGFRDLPNGFFTAMTLRLRVDGVAVVPEPSTVMHSCLAAITWLGVQWRRRWMRR